MPTLRRYSRSLEVAEEVAVAVAGSGLEGLMVGARLEAHGSIRIRAGEGGVVGSRSEDMMKFIISCLIWISWVSTRRRAKARHGGPHRGRVTGMKSEIIECVLEGSDVHATQSHSVQYTCYALNGRESRNAKRLKEWIKTSY